MNRKVEVQMETLGMSKIFEVETEVEAIIPQVNDTKQPT